MTFWVIFKNRLKIIFSDKLFIAAVILIPLAMSLIMGYIQRREKLGYIPVAVADEDQTDVTRLLIERFSDVEGIQVTLTGRDQALKLIREESVEAAIILYEGFTKRLYEGDFTEIVEIIKSPSTVSVDLLEEIFAAEVIRLRGAEFAYDWLQDSLKAHGDLPSRQEVWAWAERYWEPAPLMTIKYSVIASKPKDISDRVTIPPFAAASLGILVLFVMLALLFGSGWVCEERSNGTLQRIASSPGALASVFAGNAAALFALGLMQVLVFALVQKLCFDVVMLSGIGAWLVLAAYLICAVAISMFLASFFRTAAQLQAVAPVFSIVTGFLGGCLWNLAGIPEELMSISRITPQGWALWAFTALYANPDDRRVVYTAAGVLLGAAVLLFLLAYRGLASKKSLSVQG